MVYEFASQADGTVRTRSECNHGARVALYFPVAYLASGSKDAIWILLFDSAFELKLNNAPNFAPLRGTHTSKTSPEARSFFYVRR
ncbi:MAG: hypothetical protein ACI9UU_002555 [Candidatus Azotimanducaceae bacterium]|jgi:hypothetical protein